jgi:hypothetical protein
MSQSTVAKIKMRIKAPSFDPWWTYIGMGVLCSIGAAFFLALAFNLIPFEREEDRVVGLVFVFLWNVFACWLAYVFLKMPTEIVVTDSGNISLRSPVWVMSLEPGEITRLTCDSDGDWLLHHTTGKLDLRYFKYNELKHFLRWLVRTNSYVQAPDELK